MIVIYKIESPSGKVYIGQSRNVELRLRSYRSGNCHKQKKLKASINKYGWDEHWFEIIQEIPDDAPQNVVNECEQIYMDIYRDRGIELLNIREGGSNGKHSQESIDKMKGNCGVHMIGRKLSKESIEKRTEKQKGMKRSEESKEKYRQSKLGSNNPAFGKPAWNKGIKGSTRKKAA